MSGKESYIKWLLCVLFLFGTVRTTAAGRIIYVDDDAVGTNDGSSWANAYNNLQDAIAIASTGDEIRVAEGVYTPDKGSGIALGDRTATFQLINGIALMGGYAGLSTLDSDVRDVEIYETILSGDLKSNDNETENSLSSDAALEDNSFRVIVVDSADKTAVLDGFTIAAGKNARRYSARRGDTDGLYVNNGGRITIVNCRFTNNQAGAMSVNGNPFFIDCVFEGNTYALDIQDRTVASLNNCTFLDHYTGITITESEAVLNGCNFERTFWTGVKSSHSKLELTDCNFTATEFLGALNIDNGNVTLERCVFSSNAGSHGGAIEFTDGTLIASDCIFTNNTSHSGGAIGFRGNLDLLNCHFRNNYSTFEGGALAGYGELEQTAVVSGCTFTGNTAAYNGGAISLLQCNIILSNCTLVGNRGRGSTVWGFGGFDQNVEFRNCIICDGPVPFEPDLSISHYVTIEYSNIEGGWPGEGNIEVNPCFVNPGYWDPNGTPDDPNDDFWIEGDYHLKSQAGRWDPLSESWVIDDITSPCIDAGDPNSPVAFEPFPNGGIINMGAYGGTAEASLSPSGIHTKYGSGSGTADDPYLIYTAEQMNAIGDDMDNWNSHFKLMADVDLKDLGDSSFNLIGSGPYPFKGVFDGNGHLISNLTYAVTGNEDPTDDAIIAGFGLFRSINDPNAMFRDLRLVNPDIGPASTCAKRLLHVGALVGSLGSGTVSNCQVEGGQVQGDSRTGGLAGLNRGTISDCYTTCRVQQVEQRSLVSDSESQNRCEFFGGLVGVNLSEISNCYAVGKISGERKIGGLVGEDSGIISNCWSDSDVSGDLDIGGLVGKNRYTSVLSNCYAAGYVSGTKSIGGLIGYCTGSIIDCHATGNVSAEQWVGGLAGLNEGTITSCYSIASVSVDSDTAGGLVGLNGGTILTSLARGDVIGEQSIGGLVGENRKWYQVVAGIPIEYDGVVLDSYAEGNAYGKYGVGGLVGTNTGTILKCYSIGEVTGEMNFGGLVGTNGEIQVMGSFWDTEMSGLDTSSDGIGKTTTEMQMAGTFLNTGWDFVDETENGTEDIWWILEGQDYPRLWWEPFEEGE